MGFSFTGILFHLFRAAVMGFLLIVALRRREQLLGKIMLAFIGIASLMGIFFIIYYAV
jgi:hypothetical protein